MSIKPLYTKGTGLIYSITYENKASKHWKP